MRYLIFLQLALLVLIASCGGGAGGVGSFLAKGDAPAVSSVNFANDQLIINGSNLAGVTSVSVEGEDFDVESISETQLVVNAQQALAFIAGATYNLLVSNAFGAATYSITFTPDNNSITTNMIVDSAITTNKIADEAITESKLSDMGASDGDFLQWDQTTTSWIPTTLNGLTYMGTWDASSGSPPTDPGAGGYYIVSVAGDTDVGSATDPWSVGDWVIKSDSEWQKIDNSNAVTNVFGRQGAITAVEGDYNIDLLGDVDTTTATPADGQVLTWDQAGGNWVPATESDPKVGTLTNGKWCTTDGNVINCESAPGAETDPVFGAHVASSITNAGSGIVISVAERNGITNNATSISTNATNIASNDSNIATNVTNISTNATNISSNDTDIATNVTNISTNAGNISSNDTDIATNVTNISNNATNISSNDTDIATNVTNISTNATNISSNDTDIAAQATAISGKVTAAGETGGQTIIGGTADDENLTLIASSATPGYILLNPTSGKVGIGTTTPSGRLDVIGATELDTLNIDRGVDGYPGIKLREDGVQKWKIENKPSDLFYIANASNSYKLTITQAGNVGIGSDVPAAKLDVVGAINAQQLCDENGSNCNDLSSGAIAVTGDVSAGGGNVSVGTTDSTYNITFEGDTDQTIGVIEQSSGAGSSLTINSGAAQSGSTDQAGGNLILSSGSATGSGGSSIEFKTATSGASGTVTATPSTKMVITEAGYVGIGTTTPQSKLHVRGSTYAGGIKVVDSSTSSNSPVLEVIGKRSDANNSQSFGGGVALSQNYTGAAVVANKKLGTTYFGGNHTDGSEGNILYSASISGVAEGTFTNATTMPTGLSFFTGTEGYALGTANQTYGTERMRIDSSGNIGIGTTTPTMLMHLAKTSADGTGFLKLQNTQALGTGGAHAIQFFSRDNTPAEVEVARIETDVVSAAAADSHYNMHFKTAQAGALTTKMTLKHSGYVGIGTTDPASKLEVVGTIKSSNANGGFVYTFPGDGNIELASGDDNHSFIDFKGMSNLASDFEGRIGYTDGTGFKITAGGSPRLVIAEGGNVGIGTTNPGQMLDVSGVIRSLDGAATAGLGKIQLADTDTAGSFASIQGNPNGEGMIFSGYTDGEANPQMTLHNGKVGIGTTEPGAKLHVKNGKQIVENSGGAAIDITRPTDNFGYIDFQTSGVRRWHLGVNANPEAGSDSGSNFYINRANDAGTFVDTPFTIMRNSGNIGIMNTSPIFPLQIGSNSNNNHVANTVLKINGAITFEENVAATETALPAIKQNSRDGVAQDLNIGTRSSTGQIEFYTGNTGQDGDFGDFSSNIRMVIDSTGNVGIGSATPSAKLDVQDGSIQLTQVDGTVPSLRLWGGAGYSAPMIHSYNPDNATYPYTRLLSRDGFVFLVEGDTVDRNSGGARLFAIEESGDVGIGTETPLEKLHVAGGDIAVGTSQSFKWKRTTDGWIPATIEMTDFGSYEGGIVFSTHPGGAVGTPNVERMRIGDDGNVGIGTDTPARKLTVSWSTGTNGILVENTNSSDTIIPAEIVFDRTAISASQKGAVGVDHTGRDMFFWFNGADRMTINESGYVGIGSTSPGYKLDVGSGWVNSVSGYKTNGADYAEYFLTSEPDLKVGTIVGINPATGLARAYRDGDQLLGIVATGEGFIGNSNIVNESSDDYLLVGLVGQLDFIKEGTNIKNNTLYTNNNVKIGILLANGKVYIGTGNKHEVASLEAENKRLKAKVDKAEQERNMLKDFLCKKYQDAPLCNK